MDFSADFADRRVPKRIVLGPMRISHDNISIDFLHRQEELDAISNALDSARIDGSQGNLFLYGPSGTGKTTCIRNVLSRYNKWGRIVPIYLNCHEYRTKMALVEKIVFGLGNPVSRRGFAFYEVFERIKGLLRKDGKTLLLVLDDFDSLQHSESFELLSPLVEANENESAKFTVMLIANKFEAFERLDVKIKSSLMFRVVHFEPYGSNKIADILRRASEGTIAPDSLDRKVIDKIAKLSESKEGNARFAIWLLFSSAKNAEDRKAERIELEDVAKAYESVLPIRSSSKSKNSDLSWEESLIVDILMLGEKSSSEIYEVASKKLDRSKRQIRNYLDSLIRKGYIESEIMQDFNSIIKPRRFKLRGGIVDGIH